MKRRPKMRHCDECKFAELRDNSCLCAHGNKSVFVMPAGYEDIQSAEWGWMLRCADFKKGEEIKNPILTSDQIEELDRQAGQRKWRAEGAVLSLKK